MKVVGLDISRRSTGIAFGDGTCPPRTDCASFKGPTLGDINHNFRKWFREKLVLEKPDFVMIEAAFIAPTDDAWVRSIMIGLNMTAQGVCAGRNIPCATVACQTWRKAFIGEGYPKNPKLAAINMCEALGWEVYENHDRAEACGLWAYGHLEHGNSKAMHRLLSDYQVRRIA